MNLKSLCLLFILVGIGFPSLWGQTLLTGIVKDANTKQPITGVHLSLAGQGKAVTTNTGGRFYYQNPAYTLASQQSLTIWHKAYEPLSIQGEDLLSMQGKQVTFLLQPLTETAAQKGSDSLQSLTVFWDFSEVNRLNREAKALKALERLLKDHPYEATTVYLFSSHYAVKQMVPFEEVDAFLKDLKSLPPKGLPQAGGLPRVKQGTLVIFSNNAPLFGTFEWEPWVPTYHVLDRKSSPDIRYFEELMGSHKGGIVPLTDSMEVLAYLTGKPLPENNESVQQTNERLLKGSLKTPSGTPVANATLQINKALKTYFSDEEGVFEIPAKAGDLISIKALGMYAKDLRVEDPETFLALEMIPKYTELEEVVIEQKLTGRFDYDASRSIERVNNRNYAVRTFFKKDIPEDFAGSVMDYLNKQNKMNVRVVWDPKTFQFLTYVGKSLAKWIIDGEEGDPKSIGSAQQIERISVYEGYSMVDPTPSRIIVTTKFGVAKMNAGGRDPKTYALLNNTFDETLPQYQTMQLTDTWALAFQGLSKEAVAKKYAQLRKSNYENLDFYVSTALMFNDSLPSLSKKVMEDLILLSAENEEALRLAGYAYLQMESYSDAVKVFRRVLQIQPNDAQSYRDLAWSCVKAGYWEEAFYGYTNLLNGLFGFEFNESFQNAISQEFKYLITNHKRHLPFEKLPPDWMVASNDFGLRFVLEWNQPRASFQVQFVNPQRRFYNQEVTAEGTYERMLSFETDRMEKGSWMVNIQSLNPEERFPVDTYLTLSVYKQQGKLKPLQLTTKKLIPLDALTGKSCVLKVSYP